MLFTRIVLCCVCISTQMFLPEAAFCTALLCLFVCQSSDLLIWEFGNFIRVRNPQTKSTSQCISRSKESQPVCRPVKQKSQGYSDQFFSTLCSGSMSRCCAAEMAACGVGHLYRGFSVCKMLLLWLFIQERIDEVEEHQIATWRGYPSRIIMTSFIVALQ